jgi:tetratricopeptide (TPR) repeat protein
VLAGFAAASVAALAVTAWGQTGHWRSTLTLFERNLVVEPDSYYAHKRLATIRLQLRDFDAAERHYLKVYEIRPDEGRDDLVSFHLAMADFAIKRGDWEEALRRYRMAVEVDPEHVRANGFLGMALFRLDRPSEARPHLEKALAGHPAEARLHAVLGEVAAAEGDWPGAIQYTRKALTLAEQQGDRDLQESLRVRLGTYQSHATHVAPRPDGGN